MTPQELLHRLQAIEQQAEILAREAAALAATIKPPKQTDITAIAIAKRLKKLKP
jgi:prefoldin subunit 5